MNKFKFPFKTVDDSNSACGDPECCGGRSEWMNLVDADGSEIIHGAYPEDGQVKAIEEAFKALYERNV